MSRLFILLQYLLPQHLLSRLTGYLADRSFTSTTLIKLFIRRYRVDMSEAEFPDPDAYACFNDFFTRALKPGARPLAGGSGVIVSPADGAISQFGAINENRLFQAKGHEFTLQALLADSGELATQFTGGEFMTVYLSPRDYHRVHLPLAGKLRRTAYVPGKLFSVNAATTNAVPGLFARNERYVMEFETCAGPMAVIMVGAMIVAAIETVWAGQVCPRPGLRELSRQDYSDHTPPIELATGAEIGRFKLGSTVIMLFPRAAISFAGELQADDSLRMGQRIGTVA